MSLLTLPSGRQVELHEPTYGEVLDLVLAQPQAAGVVVAAKLALIARGISAAEIRELSYADGQKLASAVSALWDQVTADAD